MGVRYNERELALLLLHIGLANPFHTTLVGMKVIVNMLDNAALPMKRCSGCINNPVSLVRLPLFRAFRRFMVAFSKGRVFILHYSYVDVCTCNPNTVNKYKTRICRSIQK